MVLGATEVLVKNIYEHSFIFFQDKVFGGFYADPELDCQVFVTYSVSWFNIKQKIKSKGEMMVAKISYLSFLWSPLIWVFIEYGAFIILSRKQLFFLIGWCWQTSQVYHVCISEPESELLVPVSFLCPNGTIFNQELFTCEWW